MKWICTKNFLIPLGAVVLCLGAGCTKPLVMIKGKVVRDGKPITLGKKDFLQMILYPAQDEKGHILNCYNATFLGKEGSFKILGDGGKGIPPGEYRIAVKQLVNPNEKDKLKGAFNSKDSPINRKFDRDQEIVIDLSNPAG